MATKTESKTSLGQTEVWIDRKGNEHRIDDMSVSYKTNVVRYVERRALRIVVNALVDAYVAGASRTVPCVYCEARGIENPHEWEHGTWHRIGPVPGSEADEILSEAELPVLPQISQAQAVALVRATPLMARLIDDIANNRGGEDG